MRFLFHLDPSRELATFFHQLPSMAFPIQNMAVLTTLAPLRGVPNAPLLKIAFGRLPSSHECSLPFEDTEEDENHQYLALFADHPEGEVSW